MDIAERLRTVRKSKNISVYRLSQMSGISETHIRDLERGDRNPSFDTLSRLAKPLGLSLSELFNESDTAAFLTKDEKELVECFRMLSQDKADSLLRFLKTLV
ncbi:MAG TPA: helix-turn-helix transcriptional regulator [Candidatus Ornithomonoglobus merdipullorum]|uniref:Helix-turn-helix transcriptional regulator n=1 Tax=Candidatus Ornithomonoglobus merdipullorum TaxID=2840895 RepID=A0A9D1SE10_9FIRM|nr:helix-turn-helix transcriptional regulator [Candidatus Ornithomonoglobus merdipullorum]